MIYEYYIFVICSWVDTRWQ